MILFFKKGRLGSVNPIAVVDYTRSDDQYSRPQILRKALSIGTDITKSVVNGAALQVFSLSYQIHYRHSGVQLGASLKTSCEMNIDNAPAELTSLINLQAVTGQESVLSLQNAVKKVLDPEVEFPYCAVVFKTAPSLIDTDIVRSFIVYSMSYNYDSKRVNNTLALKGGNFDSMVMRLNLAVQLKTTLPLVTQLQTSLASTGYRITSDPSIAALPPVIERYYPPAALNTILSEVCKDNGLFYDLNTDEKKISLKSLSKIDAPIGVFNSKFCFRGQVSRANIISNFSIKDFATVVFEAEIEDVNLFDVITIYDDSGTDGTLFDSFRKSALPPRFKGTTPIYAYDFSILQYEYMDSRTKTTVRITATNNWLVSNFRLETFLENAVYTRGVL